MRWWLMQMHGFIVFIETLFDLSYSSKGFVQVEKYKLTLSLYLLIMHRLPCPFTKTITSL